MAVSLSPPFFLRFLFISFVSLLFEIQCGGGERFPKNEKPVTLPPTPYLPPTNLSQKKNAKTKTKKMPTQGEKNPFLPNPDANVQKQRQPLVLRIRKHTQFSPGAGGGVEDFFFFLGGRLQGEREGEEKL